jgi:2-haloacid dehalogenase
VPQESPIPNIKACVFDAYGTLFDVHSAVGKYETLAELPGLLSA